MKKKMKYTPPYFSTAYNMVKLTLWGAVSGIIFFVGVGLLSAGIILTTTPFCIAGVMAIFVGGLFGFAANTESR